MPYVGPTIISGVRPDARIATEEIFGPVLAVIRAKDFDEALRIANAPAYKLTGGIYTRKPMNLERAKRETWRAPFPSLLLGRVGSGRVAVTHA
jgi:acyl-CoA reductase-like NAD-dependent aldehyde dehydrogenase